MAIPFERLHAFIKNILNYLYLFQTYCVHFCLFFYIFLLKRIKTKGQHLRSQLLPTVYQMKFKQWRRYIVLICLFLLQAPPIAFTSELNVPTDIPLIVQILDLNYNYHIYRHIHQSPSSGSSNILTRQKTLYCRWPDSRSNLSRSSLYLFPLNQTPIQLSRTQNRFSAFVRNISLNI